MRLKMLRGILVLVMLFSNAVVIFCAEPDKATHAKRLNQMKTTLKKGPNSDWCREIEQITGLKGTLDKKENVYKVTSPRSDLDVQVSGVKLVSSMGLTSWAAFKNLDNRVMVMGDMVLTEGQVNPVMSVALANGLEVTALHNHFLGDSPRIMFMHISGMGRVKPLSMALAEVFGKIKETADTKASSSTVKMDAGIDVGKGSLDLKKIDDILGVKGQSVGSVYKVVIGKRTKMSGFELGPAMGINTWAAFAGSDDAAIVDGDFVVFEFQLQSVLKALRKANLTITAIHNHMVGESPRMIFLHYWGTGKSADLARGIRFALDIQHRRR